MTPHLEHGFAPHGCVHCSSGTVWADGADRTHPMTSSSRVWLPVGYLPRAAACRVPISFCLPQRRWIPSACWNVTTEHPKKHRLSPRVLKNTDIFQQEHSVAPLPCSHRDKHQGSWRGHQTRPHTHISKSPPQHPLLSSLGEYSCTQTFC